MTDTTCVRCERPMPDQAYACGNCAHRAGDQLFGIVDTAPAARDVAHGFARRGGGTGGSSEGRLILNLAATQRLDSVQGSLTTWVRHIAAERGLPLPAPQHLGDDALVVAARWLAGHTEWMRHRREVGEFLEDVGACSRVVAGIVRGPGSKRYLGPCGATVGWDDQGAEVARDAPCDGDVYAHDGAKDGACRVCGARWTTAKRQAWLDGEVRDHAYRASEIEDAYGVSADTIRVWAARGKVPIHARDRLGRALYLLSTVLDYAAAKAVQRETQRAKRELRAATRETEDAA
jgi:hypothetical protein